ncbi:MAG TPA: hypothetical protein VM639_24620 [Dongiaceae bacterium]|nr:hypothetical protein [Dongiaceae bacterium]
MRILIAAASAAFLLLCAAARADPAPACIPLQAVVMHIAANNPRQHFTLIIASPAEAALLVPYLAKRAGHPEMKGDDVAALRADGDPGNWYAMVLYHGCVEIGMAVSIDDLQSVLGRGT